MSVGTAVVRACVLLVAVVRACVLLVAVEMSLLWVVRWWTVSGLKRVGVECLIWIFLQSIDRTNNIWRKYFIIIGWLKDKKKKIKN